MLNAFLGTRADSEWFDHTLICVQQGPRSELCVPGSGVPTTEIQAHQWINVQGCDSSGRPRKLRQVTQWARAFPTTPQPNQIQPSPAQPKPLSFWKSDDERRLLRAGDSKWEWLIYALHSSFNRQPAKEKRDSENFSKLFLRPNDSEM